MIDFACRNFRLDEVIKCGLGLSKADFMVFEFFLKNKDKEFSTTEASKRLGLELSTVQRAVKKLHEKGILFKSQRNIEGGGYLFNYRIKSKQEIKKVILSVIEKWSNRVEEEFDRWA